MMAAMMLPSAAPAILLVIALTKQRWRASRHSRERRVRLWVCGGLGQVFSLIATGFQWGLDRAGLLSSKTMASGKRCSRGLTVVRRWRVFYQLTPRKQACRRHCRSPLEFLTRYWRRGPLGPMRAGAWHGTFCLGCCWMLMGLLFVGGLMNLLWIAGLALLVLIEKLFPLGPRVSQLTGVGLIGWGLFVLVR